MKTGKRNVYLQMKPLEEARALFLERFEALGRLREELIDVRMANGRVTAKPVFARCSSPNYHAAAMDGIAVKAAQTFGATIDRPKDLRIGRDAFFVNTGRVLPGGTDAVIMIENVLTLDDETVRIETAAYPWQHVRKVGEDIVATEMILPQNHRVTAYDVGALLNGGVFEIAVKERPKVQFIPTGSELIRPEDVDSESIPPDRVIESNSAVLSILIERCGGEPLVGPIVPDVFEAIAKAVDDAVKAEAHIVIISAGSSAGSEDYTAAVIGELGEVLVHGVTMMPGKPTVLGVIEGKPVMGNPGYPVSAVFAFEMFVEPLIYKMLGTPPSKRPTVKVRAAKKLASKLGLEEFIRVKLGRVHGTIVAAPLPRGAGSVTTLAEADGIIRIPSHIEGLHAGETTEAELLRDLDEIEQTVVVVGSHDNTLDLLSNLMRATHGHPGLSSSNVGSLGGLIALREGYCHAAGCHLLDTETGAYNVSYVERYLPDMPVWLVNLVYRQQGLIVRKGNPKGIAGIEDLCREDVTFVNRQAGSGTRILLDHRLSQLHIGFDSIKGYDQEEFTHMAVAVNVLSGAADAGLGIYAAARALNLDFVPVVTEQYDLVIPEAFWQDQKIVRMVEVIRSKAFKELVEGLGGYDTGKTGTVIARVNRDSERIPRCFSQQSEDPVPTGRRG